MSDEKLSYIQIQEIARELTSRYSPNELPSLEDVAWAFPVEGQERVYYQRLGYLDRIPNVQEGNALRELMTFKNFKNILEYLPRGETVGRAHAIPNHTFPCGDAED
jgi:hypothetical protein